MKLAYQAFSLLCRASLSKPQSSKWNPDTDSGGYRLSVLRETIRPRAWIFLRVFLFLLVTGIGSVQAVTILNTNFDTAALGVYSNAGVINSSGATTSQLVVAVSSSQTLQVVNVGGSNQALQFIDNSTVVANCYAKHIFSALSTTTTGNNFLSGSFSFTPMGPSTGDPLLEFMVNAGFDSAGSSVTAIQLDLRGGGAVSYKSGSSSVTGPTLTTGVKYNISIYLDLSSSTQDTWGLTISRSDTGAVVYSVSNLYTRAANIAPDRIVFSGGLNAAALSASPFAQVDDISFSAAPYDISCVKGPYFGDCLVESNLARAELGSCTDGGVINGGQAIQERLGVNVSTSSGVQVVSLGSGKKLIQFIDNSSSVITSPMVKKYFNPLSTTSTGSNSIAGSFEVTPMGPAGGNPTFQFALNSGSDTSGSTVSAVQIEVRGAGGVTYKVGSTTVTGPTLAVGVSYVFNVSADLSSDTQDTWGFKITRLDTGVVVYSADNLATRAANIAPDRIICNGGVNSSAANALPFVQLGAIEFFANSHPVLAAVPLRMGGGDMVNGVIDSTVSAKFQTLASLGVGLARVGLYPGYYWNYDSKYGTKNTPNTVSVENQILMAYSQNVQPILIFNYYGQYQSIYALGDYNQWYQIGQAFAAKFGPNSAWLTSQGITNWGITCYYAFNEPDTIGGTANTPPIPVTGTVSYREGLRGLADGVHSVSPGLKVFPAGFARPNGYSDYTCNGYCTAIADLLNDGHLDGITLHTYFPYPISGYSGSSQNMFNQVKSTCGITRDINFYCDEYNFVLNSDTQSNAALNYLTLLWDAIGVVGKSGQPVSQLALPWNLFNTVTDDPNYGMCTQLTPSWVPTLRGQVFELVSDLTQGMQIISADPTGTGEYKLVGNNQTMWVWQNRAYWSNHVGTTYTVQNIPIYATTLSVYSATGLIQSVTLSGQMSYQVTGLTSGQTYMFVVDSQP